MYKFSISSAVALIVTAVLAHSQISGQGLSVPRADLGITAYSIAIEYGDQRILGGGAILRGEPIEFDVGVFNRRLGQAAAAEHDWFERVSITVRPEGAFDPDPPPATPSRCARIPENDRPRKVRQADDHLLIGLDGGHIVRCRLDVSSRRFVGGKYTVTAEWTHDADLRRWPLSSPAARRAVGEFEIREVATEADELDLLNHLAFRALDQANASEALELTQRALRLEPLSSTALILRGRAQAAQGRCREAKADWQFAASVIQNGTDHRALRNRRRTPDERSNAAEHWRQMANRLSCR